MSAAAGSFGFFGPSAGGDFGGAFALPIQQHRSWPEERLKLTASGKCTQCGKCACDRMTLAECHFEGGRALGGCGDCLSQGPCQCHLPPEKRENKAPLFGVRAAAAAAPPVDAQSAARNAIVAAKRNAVGAAAAAAGAPAAADAAVGSTTADKIVERLDKLIASNHVTNNLLTKLLAAMRV
jgi:hypothetical protein